MDFEQALITARIESAKQSISRLRFVLLLNVIASVSVLLAVWNGYFSWYRFFALKNHCDSCMNEEPTRIAAEQLLKSWVDSTIINISPLGMRFGVSDLGFVGPVGLMMFTGVMFYFARRENHAVSYVLLDYATSGQEAIGLIFHAISAELIFLPISSTDACIRRLEYPSSPKPRGITSRRGFDVLVFLPVLAVIAIIVGDIASVVYLPAPFRKGHQILWLSMPFDEKRQFFAMEMVPFALGVIVCWVCSLTRTYSYGTVQVLREFGALIKTPERPAGLRLQGRPQDAADV